MTFSSLGLAPKLLSALETQGYQNPTPIQLQAIPEILNGKDLMAAAQTGTGKTAAFTLPLLQNLSASSKRVQSNNVRALVLTPTRELAAQVGESVGNYGRDLSLKHNIVFGGVKINPQMMKLRRGTDVLIATPGRLLDLYQQNAIKFSQLEILVLDEADRMLDMGFIHDIKKIMALLPKRRQTLLFSATFSDEIRALARGIVRNPVEVSVAPPNTTVELIEQRVYPAEKPQKAKLLVHLIKKHGWFQVLVFCRTKYGADKLTKVLGKQGIQAAAIHGNKSQNARTRALMAFKQNNVQVLVATDIAARGIDIAELPNVVNYELPHVAEDYVHRIGRTGRAGESGLAVSLVSAEESRQLAAIQRLIKLEIPQQVEVGFEPDQSMSTMPLSTKSDKPKKPKKPKRNRANADKPSNDATTDKPKRRKPQTRRRRPRTNLKTSEQ